ncbi:hypothetical protein FRB96_006765 [Tulasnella sp. 330]|nr:hypothetical protein FRB96_006765 [Tulasnella sp. 330]
MAQGYYDEAIAIYAQAQEVGCDLTEVQAIAQEPRAAEAELKASQSKDHYGILKIPKSASETEIRKA